MEAVSYIPSKFVMVDEQPNDGVRHQTRFGGADHFASQTLDASALSEVLTLNFLGVGLVNRVPLSVESL